MTQQKPFKIEAKQRHIQVQINDHLFDVNYNDDTNIELLGIEKRFKSLMKDFEEAREKSDHDMLAEGIKDIKEQSKKEFDLVLGEGAFDKVYEDVRVVTDMYPVLMQVIEYVLESINKDNQKKAREKYLQNKQK